MKNGGYRVVVEDDLCEKVMETPSAMSAAADGVILACHSRAVSALFDWLGLKAKQTEDIRDSSAEETLSRFGLSYSDAKDSAEKNIFQKKIEEFPVKSRADAWYPVLDKTRCVECGKCHDFCLFGVYAVENKHVRVVHPQSCKNSCPACARVCPNRAIIFPKYEKSPINGGTAEEEIFTSEEMDKMYRERLQLRLRQRRASVSLLKNDANDA